MLPSVEQNFARLESLSQRLNASSDSLTESIERIEKKLASLRLGVSAFDDHPLYTRKCTSTEGEYTYHYNLAYTKGDSGWGLVIWGCDTDNSVREEIPLLQAPREQRIMAMHRLPALLEELEGKAAEALEEVRKALGVAETIS